MHAALGIVDDFLARDPERVFLRLDLQLILVDAWQFYDCKNIVALLKNVYRRVRTLACCLIVKPLTAGARFKGSLQIEQSIEWIGKCCDHAGTRVGATK